MLRSLFCSLCLFVLTASVVAQPVKKIELGANGNAFSFHGQITGNLRTFESDADAKKIVQSLMASMGLPLRFEVRAAAIPNAAAVLQQDGSRLILYDTIFMDKIKAKTGHYWSLISIMAHEIGHHLAFHLQKHVDDHDAELEADYFSGYILAKQGASMDDALAAMREIASDTPTKTHPGRADRLQAIAAGWKNAAAGERAQPTEVARRAPGPASPQSAPARAALRHAASPRIDAKACAERRGIVYCASSYLPTRGVNKSNYGPESLADGDDRTAWVEGRSGTGIGEWVLLDWQNEKRVTALTVKNGYAKTGTLFRRNGRVREVRLRFSNGNTVMATLEDTRDRQTLTLNRPQTAKWVKVEIMDARRGEKYADTALNELHAVFE